MTVLIELLENLIKDNVIVKKQIKIDNRNITVFVKTKEYITVEFSFEMKSTSQYKEMSSQIKKLIDYNVESNLPF